MKLKKIQMNKRGVLGLETATRFVLAIMILAVIVFAVIVALASLAGSNALTVGSQEQQDVNNTLANVTSGIANDLMSNAGTWFSLISVVIIILIISVVIVAVNRFGGSGGTAGL